MKKRIHAFLPYLAMLCLSAAAIGLRFWLLASADPAGLLKSGHPAYGMLLILTAFGLAVAALFAFSKKCHLIRIPFPAEAVGALLAALGILLGEIFQHEMNVLSAAAAIAGIAGFAGISLFRLQGRKAPLVLFMLTTGYMVVRLLLHYRQWSMNSQPYNYLFEVCCSLFLMILCYLISLQESGSRHSRLLPFFRLGTVLLCALCLPGTHSVFYGAMGLWCLSGAFRRAPAMVLPEDVRQCIRALEDAGHATYAVGGCVRDALMGKTPHDYDLCSAATPEEICDIFQNRTLVHSGEKHGTVGVVIRRQVYEITTFRAEGGYADARHPDWVKFVPTVEEDLARRDFTVNAMAYAPRTGYVDPYGGQEDLEDGILRCVGDPEERFREDPLRILRGMRFAARFGFRLEEKTFEAMQKLAPLMEHLARERVLDELNKFLPYATAEDFERFAPILTQVIPELESCVGFQQHSRHHAYDVYTHTAHVVQQCPKDPVLRWAALLHDIAKPQTFHMGDDGQGHFYGHAIQSAECANQILRRLKAPNALREQVVFLIEHHMTPLEPEERMLRRRLSQYGEDRLQQLLTLQEADFSAKGTGVPAGLQSFRQVRTMLQTLLQEESCLQIKDLAISGDDLIALGFQPGPKLGSCLERLLEMVLDQALPNEKEALLEAARTFLE